MRFLAVLLLVKNLHVGHVGLGGSDGLDEQVVIYHTGHEAGGIRVQVGVAPHHTNQTFSENSRSQKMKEI